MPPTSETLSNGDLKIYKENKKISQSGKIEILIPVDYFITECAFDAAVYFCGDERTLEL